MLQQPVHVDTIGLYVVNTLSITGLLRGYRDLPQDLPADGENVYQINIRSLIFTSYA